MAYLTVEAKIEAALLTRVASLVLTPALEVAWPGQTFPRAGQDKPPSYLRVEHTTLGTERQFIGSSGPHRYTGLLLLSVCLPLGTSTTVARDKAGLVADHFPVDHELELQGVTVRITKRPTVQNGYHDTADARWRTPIVVQYEAFA